MERPVNRNTRNIAIFLAIALFAAYSYISSKDLADVVPSYHAQDAARVADGDAKCDIFTGEWVPNQDTPYYKNTTCWAIHEHQNCMKYGRPDTGFLKWRWKPDGCDLPVLDPFRFLDMVRGKSMAFVGDSVGRNQMQSLICLLSRVEYPKDISPTPDDRFKRFSYVTYNFTLAVFWTPFLVRSEERRDSDGPSHTGLFNIFLDEPDTSWTAHIDDFDYVILNAGHWFTRTAVYYENQHIIGCRYCMLPNVTEVPYTYAYGRVFRTAFDAINARKNFRGVTFLRTFAPSHFEGGEWNAGGNCVRRRPFRSNETILQGWALDMYMNQLEEFKVAQRVGKKEFRLMDITQAMLMRPDGHPSRYGHWPNENVTLYNDCVHWCLPGPIDAWADMLSHMIEMEGWRTTRESLLLSHKKLQ